MNWDDTNDTAASERLVESVADREDQAVEAALRPQGPGRVHRPGEGPRAARPRAARRPRPRRHRRPRAALRRPRPRQDHALHDHRRGDGRPHPHHLGPRHPARRRPGRDPLLPPGGRGPLPRRDPPHVPARRGDAVHGDGGLPRRRDRRQGPRRHRHPAGAAALHPGRRHHPGRLPAAAPLRDRFGFTAHMEFYEPGELERVVHRSASLLDVEIDAEGAAEIAGRSRGTPRIANRLLRRVRDYAQVKTDGRITKDVAAAALAVYEVDARGLDRLDRAVLEALLKLFGGGPVGLSTLAVAVGRSVRPWRRWPSPSWCGRDCSPVPRGDGWRRPRPGRTSASPRRARRPRETDKGTCSGRDGEHAGPGRNPGAMLSVVPVVRTRLDSADAALAGGAPYPQPSGRSPTRSCEGSSDP